MHDLCQASIPFIASVFTNNERGFNRFIVQCSAVGMKTNLLERLRIYEAIRTAASPLAIVPTGVRELLKYANSLHAYFSFPLDTGYSSCGHT